MAFTTIDGIRTHYELIGNGPPLLMYSPGGFDASLDKWSGLGVYAKTNMLAHLSKKFQCIVFDRRETGDSGGRVEQITWHDYVNQGQGLLDKLGVESAHLLGGCMGCCPVIAHAVRHPDSVRNMILYWPVGGPRFRIKGFSRFAEHMNLVEEQGMAGVADLALRTTVGFGKDPRIGPWAPVIRSDPEFAAMYRHFDVDSYKKILTEMPRALFDRDTVPGAEPEDLLTLNHRTLVVPGKDAAHATSAARYLEECLPNSEYWDLLPEEQTEQTIPQQLIEFLERDPC